MAKENEEKLDKVVSLANKLQEKANQKKNKKNQGRRHKKYSFTAYLDDYDSEDSEIDGEDQEILPFQYQYVKLNSQKLAELIDTHKNESHLKKKYVRKNIGMMNKSKKFVSFDFVLNEQS